MKRTGHILALLAAMSAPLAAQQDNAEAVSTEVFGPRAPVDYAFGAFQRGYFLTALELALPRAEQGDAAAQTLIAEIYSKGLGVGQSAERAASWYQLASDNGDRLATFELGMLYQDGVGVTKDRSKAAELFLAAANAGYPPAKYNLALLHVEGIYAEPSLTKAAELMKEAADAELAEAQYDYGSMLLEGAGVFPDEAEGARYIGLAAEQGLAAAQVDYATLLYLGQGIARNVKEAVSWYGKAAQSGNPVAQNRYAKLLAVGEGIAIDLESAAMWRALSRRQGLTDPSLDRLLVSLAPEALARAEERARYWPSLPPGTVAPPSANSVEAVGGPDLPNPLDPENAPSQVVDPNPTEEPSTAPEGSDADAQPDSAEGETDGDQQSP